MNARTLSNESHKTNLNKPEFKRVPALDKCFKILGLLARSKSPLGASEISTTLKYNKSTVYNILHTLVDLAILEYSDKNKFSLGVQLYALGGTAVRDSQLINVARPYLEEINRKTRLSTFLSILSGGKAVIVDKVDSPFDMKVSTEIGMKHPLFASAVGRALLSQIPDADIDKILLQKELKRYTRFTCLDKRKHKRMIQDARKKGIAFSKGEFIEGLRAIAAPVRVTGRNLPVAIWVIGLDSQIKGKDIQSHSSLLKELAEKIRTRLSSR